MAFTWMMTWLTACMETTVNWETTTSVPDTFFPAATRLVSGGAVLGGLLLGVIASLASGYIGALSGGVLGSNYRDIFAFLVLVLVLVLRPSGLLGQHSGDRA